jgi:proliferating cell nuclear antigen PCNA
MLLEISNPARAEMFNIIFQNIKLFTDNINITFGIDQIDIQCIDSAHVAVLEVHIGSTWFDKYELSDDIEGLVIGVNANLIGKIFGTRNKMQDIAIECSDDPDTLSIRFMCEDKNVYDKSFEMPLIDLDVDVMEIPNVDYEAEFSVPSDIYASLMSQLKLFGETMDIDCSEDKIMLHSSSIDTGKMSTEISIDDLNEFSIDEGGVLNISYSLSYMCNVANFHKLSEDIELKFKQDYPVQLKYNLGTDDANVTFYIAPKIGNSD